MQPALDEPTAEHREQLAALERQLYGHVLECIDWNALFGLEQMLWSVLDELGIDDCEVAVDLAKAMISRAIVHASDDPATACSSVPYGITKAEAKAVSFDEACPFCQFEAEAAKRPKPEPHDHDEEPCGLCDDLARMWREQHADALKRHGLP
jgi:hypothetical protein